MGFFRRWPLLRTQAVSEAQYVHHRSSPLPCNSAWHRSRKSIYDASTLLRSAWAIRGSSGTESRIVEGNLRLDLNS